MAHPNLKIKKEKEYNPFTTRTIRRSTVGNVKCYLKAIKQNPKDAYSAKKMPFARYTEKGHVCFFPNGGIYDPSKVYYYEVGASDGSYRKCTTKEDAELRFSQLVEFEKRQSVIN